MQFTIPELARAVHKSEGFIRQHIHRKHLAVSQGRTQHDRGARRGNALGARARALVRFAARSPNDGRHHAAAHCSDGGAVMA